MLLNKQSHTHKERYDIFWRWHIDLPLLSGLLALCAFGLVVLYSASDESVSRITRQAIHMGIGFGAMLICAQIPSRVYRAWAPWIFSAGILLLVAVLLIGVKGGGAQRWLNLGVIRFQPSDLMRIAVPLMLAWYFCEHPMPPKLRYIIVGLVLTIIPTALIAKQPDFGTSLFIASSGIFVIFLAGIRWRYILSAFVIGLAALPLAWFFYMRDYQKQRVMTFLNPEADQWGSGYHIIQSKIAIGSGGLYGKGWLNGTQSQLDFLPERHTDFIFAVLAEEFGLVGVIVLLSMYLFVIGRGLYIGTQAQDSFGRLLAGSIILTFFVYIFVNIGMVSGLLPVVGLPLPLISYGGTSIVSMMAGFGILMSIHTHRRLLTHS